MEGKRVRQVDVDHECRASRIEEVTAAEWRIRLWSREVPHIYPSSIMRAFRSLHH
jgi:hypothetical protein